MSSGTQFSLSVYGQDRLVMAWDGLSDPFQQFLPVKITNNWSGVLWFQGQLNSPSAWYVSGAAYSGISMPSTLTGTFSGAISGGGSDTLIMSWTVSVSGQPIATSSPVTDTLTFQVNAYQSGSLASASQLITQTITITNILFNRYSGVIKLFGDTYDGAWPQPTISQVNGGSLQSGTVYTYAVSFVRSGWESDVGAPSSGFQITSGFGTINVSWSSVAGATNYYLWRVSGGVITNSISGFQYSGGGLFPADLVVITSSNTSFSDTAITVRTHFRHQAWGYTFVQGANAGSVTQDATTYFSSPQSVLLTPGPSASFLGVSHAHQLTTSASGGVTRIGPFYYIYHVKAKVGSEQSLFVNSAIYGGGVSGTLIADGTVFTREAATTWFRIGFYVSGTVPNGSGYVHMQLMVSGSSNQPLNVDDVFIVANS